MINKSNVIDLEARRNTKAKSQTIKTVPAAGAPIFDMTERRQEIINEERRIVKRTILTGFIGAFIVVPGKGLLKVAVYDISDNGLAFDLNENEGRFQVKEEVAVRVYMNNKTYFPFIATINNVREIEADGVLRHGASFLEDTVNKEALRHFVKFIENVSASLQTDSGDVMVSNLKD